MLHKQISSGQIIFNILLDFGDSMIYSGFGDCKPCGDGEEGGGGECQVFLRHLRLPQRQENGCVVLLRQTVGRKIMMNLYGKNGVSQFIFLLKYLFICKNSFRWIKYVCDAGTRLNISSLEI